MKTFFVIAIIGILAYTAWHEGYLDEWVGGFLPPSEDDGKSVQDFDFLN
jgi:hypothetical protein